MSNSHHTHTSATFSEERVLHQLEHYLPTQGPLKDFIHHNTLHAFQSTKFYDALWHASRIFGYKLMFTVEEYRALHGLGRISDQSIDRVLSEQINTVSEIPHWKERMLHAEYPCALTSRLGKLRRGWYDAYGVDMDVAVHPLLFRILGSYLDQGIALAHFPFENEGLLAAIKHLDQLGTVHFFKSKRVRTLLHGQPSITSLLQLLVGEERYFDKYLYDQQFAHRGWSGMATVVEHAPHVLLYEKNITLRDFIILELLLEIDHLDSQVGTTWKPLGIVFDSEISDLFWEEPQTEEHRVRTFWQSAFEMSYYDPILAALIESRKLHPLEHSSIKRDFQAIFCIDERECSLRRYVEQEAPNAETLGAPGFFGVEFYFHPAHAKFYEKLAPAPVTPKYLILEYKDPQETHLHRPKEVMYSKQSHTLLTGALSSYILGLPALAKLLFNLFSPKMSPAIADAFGHMDQYRSLTILYEGQRDEEKGLQIGFTVLEMADRVEKLLRGLGLVENFAPFVYLIGHGSSSANNPHHGAHDCGACSGRPGAVNARVFAWMANYAPVREELAKRGLTIPESTCFIGGLHDTAADQIEFYDLHLCTEDQQKQHEAYCAVFERALDYNAKERSRRFESITTTSSLEKVRRAIQQRSVSFFEPRPELGHGTNSLCIIGNRSLSEHVFLDRRAFLNSYDYRTDPEGKYLANVIAPLPIVCGGINLEYYFSRMDNYKLGAGTKLPHNVMGLIGVTNGSDGDLRPGLPLQMIEVHDPVRLLMIVEQVPEVVLSVITASEALYEWFKNEWVHLAVIDPKTNECLLLKNGEFVSYVPYTKDTPHVSDIPHMIEQAQGMKTNFITDATFENLPVHLITK